MSNSMPDKLTLEFTREEAYHFLLVYAQLRIVEALHSPELVDRPEVVDRKLSQLQAFVEGQPTPPQPESKS